MSAAYNAFRLHALGPCSLVDPECVGHAPSISGRGLKAISAASLLLKPRSVATAFYGFTGEDGVGSLLRRALLHLPTDLSYFRRYLGATPHGRGEDGLEKAAAFFAERATATPDWPDANCTQATWLLLDIPAYGSLPEMAASWLSRARRRTVFTVAWIDAGGLLNGKYASWAGADIDLLMVSGEPGESSDSLSQTWSQASTTLANGLSKVISVLLLSDTKVELISRGGLFGKVRSHYARLPGLDPSVVVGALLAKLALEILDEDDIPRSEVHVDRDKLNIQPLHLGLGLQWAFIAAECAAILDTGIVGETSRGGWLQATTQNWIQAHPERFTLWGGRHERIR
jgi:hypothetical protein